MPILLSTKGSRCHGAFWYLGCLLLGISPRCEAQNLVPNPSFEQIDSCPQYPTYFGFQENSSPQYWSKRLDTPDYYASCIGSVDTLPGIPLNVFGYQYAQDGGAYIGMASFLEFDLREMVKVELTEALIVGQTYYGSFWVNAAYGGPQQVGYGCSNFGMLLSTIEPAFVGYPQTLTLPNRAQVYSSQVISDTANWTLVSGSFVADSAFRYLVLGNHFDNAHTAVDMLGPGYDRAYTLVDAVCLSHSPLGCPLATAIIEEVTGAITLTPNPAQHEIKAIWGNLNVSKLVVLDALGRIRLVDSVVELNEKVLHVDSWAAGVYHLILESPYGRQEKKFVVIH
ncbi:MAG: T9SS type A sorting domain-containing protein [Flavobacteriales bacterium]|nr:T9SS type A sorting domain-containing protein [Flavobacteriales bacterium]